MARMISRAAAAASLVLFAGWAVAADDVTIGDLAPKSSLVVAGIDNWAKSEATLKESELWAMWNEPSMKAFIAEIWKDEQGIDAWDEMKKMLDELGVEEENVAMPTGAVGMAMFMPADDKADGDSPLASMANPPQMLAFADFGAGAEKMKGNIESALDRIEKKGDFELDEETYEGTTVWVIKPKPGAAAPKADAGMDEGGDEDAPPSEPPFKEVRLAWVGTHAVMCTTEAEMHAAMDRLGGDDIDSIDDAPTYAQSLGQHPAGLDAYAVMLVTDQVREAFMGGMAMSLAQAGGGADEKEAQHLIDAIGVSNLKGASLGMKINSDAGIMEQTIGVLLPDKGGIFTLFDSPAARFSPPSFVGPEASSVMQMGVQFGKVFEIAAAIAGAMPGESKETAVASVNSLSAQVGPALKSMGPEVYLVESLTRPLGMESQKSVWAIKCADLLSVANLLTGFAPMVGAEIRDFQGNQIYESADLDMSVGLGAGHMFIGASDEVENMLRRASVPDAAGIAGEARFRAAQAVAGEDSQFYMFTDLVQSLEWDFWSQANADKVALKQLEEFMDVTDEMRKEYAEMVPKWVKSVPPIDVFKRHMGDSVFSMKSTPDGFRGRMVQMRPKAN